MTGVNDSSYTTQSEITYNGLGQRLSMDAASVIAYYVMDGNRPLTAESNVNTTSYLYGLGVIGEETNAWSYSLSDGTNTQRQLTDSVGEVTYYARYTPWGDTLNTYGTGNFAFGYFGGLMDNATGLLYVGNGQYYDPEIGRFLTRNPNASGNPYLPFDPTGALFVPLGLLGLIYGRKKHKSKFDYVVIVVFISLGVGMGLTACKVDNPTGQPINFTATQPQGSPTATIIASTPTTTVVTTITPPAPLASLTPCTPTPTSTPTPIRIDDYITFTGWTDTQRAVAMEAIRKVNEKLLGDATLLKFFQVYNISTSSPLRFIKMSDNGTGCSAGPHQIKCHPTYKLEEKGPRVIVHELGHVLHQNNPARNLYGDLKIPENAIVDDLGQWVTGQHPSGPDCENIVDPNSNLAIRCAATSGNQYKTFERTFLGYTGERDPAVYHGRGFDDWNSPNEDYADMFMNWVYNTFDDSVDAYNAGTKRYDWMDERMAPFIG